MDMDMLPYNLSGPLDVFLGVAAGGGLVLGLAMIFFTGLSLRIRIAGILCFLASLLILMTVFKD